MGKADLTSFFEWLIPPRLWAFSLWSPQFFIACAPLVILCGLALSSRWARFTDAPMVFALVYGTPFLLLTFQDSLGDSIQMMESIGMRYYMSEPASTWVHYWLFHFLHGPFNVGAKFVIALSSRVAGFVYLWAVARTSQRLFPELSASRRLVYRLMFFTAGVSLLFYGYVENTPLALPAEQVWVLTSIVFLQTPSFSRLFKCAAALALATAFHGRAAFLAPALALLCWLPPGSFAVRMKRLACGGAVYLGILVLMVAYILLVDFRYVAGGVYGNALGGGNGQMFVPLESLFKDYHWRPLVGALLIAGGILVPCGLLSAAIALFRRETILVWAVGYLLSDIVFVFFWEFDYGTFMDWDLVFSGVGPFLLLASVAVTRSRIPVWLIIPFLLATAIASMAFAAIVNGGPLSLNVVPRAGRPVSESVCAHAGLRRTYFSDLQLTNPIGPSEPDQPNHFFEPTPVQPFGGVFEGYIHIPSTGRYRFFFLGQGNLRFRLANRTLYERWTNYEWQITAEREVRFSEDGWYPMRFEFSSTSAGIVLRLAMESAGQPKRLVGMEDLCHE